ncbi:MAG TPA: hypothetical protein VJB87_01405 [Candidatus Nanoarchaeia archaeon]|nr:hypothetical protein [Candidatus Nanoarchaeia archaeon]
MSPSGTSTDKTDEAFLEELVTLCDEVITQGFPELTTTTIYLDLKDDDDGSIQVEAYEDGDYLITFRRLFKQAPPTVLHGGLAHEMSHIVRDTRRRKKRPSSEQLFLQRYDHDLAYTKRYERRIDREALRRGFGKEIYAINHYLQTLGIPQQGISIQELEHYKPAA